MLIRCAREANIVIPNTINNAHLKNKGTLVGWRLYNDKNLTVGFMCDKSFIDRIAALEDLIDLLSEADIQYILSELRDDGRIDDNIVNKIKEALQLLETNKF